ncbi:hypothetical protein BHM03_00026735 [Ensete ventricosum]|nr:hypothetical protein BHM03_00026735 [Ensete ventricosum]
MRGVSQCLDDYEILSHIAGSEAKGKKTLVLATIDDRVEEAIETTKAEQVIAVPTTTLYGFACDGCLLLFSKGEAGTCMNILGADVAAAILSK